jgi:hypothetical protein
MEVFRSAHSKGDDEELLSLEGVDDGFFVVIVYLDGLDALGDGGLAVLAGECSDGVIACLEKLPCKGLANVTAYLEMLVLTFF